MSSYGRKEAAGERIPNDLASIVRFDSRYYERLQSAIKRNSSDLGKEASNQNDGCSEILFERALDYKMQQEQIKAEVSYELPRKGNLEYAPFISNSKHIISNKDNHVDGRNQIEKAKDQKRNELKAIVRKEAIENMLYGMVRPGSLSARQAEEKDYQRKSDLSSNKWETYVLLHRMVMMN